MVIGPQELDRGLTPPLYCERSDVRRRRRKRKKIEPVKGHLRGIVTSVSCFSRPIKGEEVFFAHYNTRGKTTKNEEKWVEEGDQ